MIMLKRVILTILLLALLLIHGWTSDASNSRQVGPAFIVGVFRSDGAIVPFARYANRRWSNPWPNPYPDPQPDQPNTIADLSRPWYVSRLMAGRKWHLLLTSAAATAVKTSKSIQLCSHCQMVWGLLSDYPNSEQPDKNECARNLGIALSETTDAKVMARLSSDSPEWTLVKKFIGPSFERAETANLLRVMSPLYLAQIPAPEKRAKTTLSMLNLYGTQIARDGRTIFYFEASKEYPKPADANDSGCNNISLLGGWIRRATDGNLSLLALQFSATDCDMKEGGLARPFALLHLDGRTFAIVEEDSYEGESYIILEIRKRGVERVLETSAGSC